MPTLPLLINTQSHLDDLCNLIAGCNTVALDTEFVRTSTYAPQLGLLQIAAGSTAVCVDPLADMQLAQLWELLFDPNRLNILHSATQDLEVMWFHEGNIIHNLIDTQICAALLNYMPQIGYAGLVADLVGVTISKEQTRTDWTRRPLTSEQIDYAAKDVVYLDGMHKLLRERLQQANRYQWAQDDSAMLCNTEAYKPDIQGAWQRLKSIPFMPAEQQARAMQLASWREQRAVQLDKPRKWVMDDKALLEIAVSNPSDQAALNRLSELPTGIANRQGKYLLEVLMTANADFAAHPERYQQQFSDRDTDKALSKKLSQIVRDKAAELQLPPEVLGSKRQISALIRGDSDSKLLKGWRRDVVGEALLAAL